MHDPIAVQTRDRTTSLYDEGKRSMPAGKMAGKNFGEICFTDDDYVKWLKPRVGAVGAEYGRLVNFREALDPKEVVSKPSQTQLSGATYAGLQDRLYDRPQLCQ